MIIRFNFIFDIDSFTNNPLSKYAGYYSVYLKSFKSDKQKEAGY